MFGVPSWVNTSWHLLLSFYLSEIILVIHNVLFFESPAKGVPISFELNFTLNNYDVNNVRKQEMISG